MKKNCLSFLFLVLVALVSCKSNQKDIEIDEPINPADTVIHLFTYYDGFTSDMVSIATDTSLIVKNSAIESMQLEPRNLVVVWRSIEEDAFVRRIVSTELSGEKTIIRTSYADLADLFPNANVHMNSEFYVNEEVDALTNDGRPHPERYRDPNGVYHPMVYYLPQEHDGVRKLYPDRNAVNGRVCVTAEELYELQQQTDASIEFNMLNLNLNKNGWTPIATQDSLVRITCDTLMLKVKAGVDIVLETHWFKIKKFEASVGAELAGNLTTSMYIGFEKKKQWSKDIISLSGATSTFFIGPVPVVINWKPSIVFDAELEGSVGVEFTTYLGFDLEAKAGVLYQDGAWQPIKETKKEFRAGIGAGVQGKIGAEAGIFVEGAMLLYGAAGPEIKIGPAVYADGVAEVYGEAGTSGKYSQLKLSAEVGMKLKAKLGAKIQILKWKLGEWTAEFDIFKIEFWKGEKIVPIM